MAGAGGGLGAWGPLTLLVLCSWTWPRAAAIDPVRNLAVGARTSSSITLVWEAPEGPASQNLTYWVQCIGGGDGNETQKTTGTSATVDRLDAATSYVCSVWAEQDGASGAKEDLTVSTAPNAVRNLTVGARTSSSITLVWEAPEGPASQNLTYWVQCIGGGDGNETQKTTGTSATVDRLDAATSYACSVWAEQDGASGAKENLTVSTAPNAVRNLTVGARTSSSITLVWEAPEGPASQNLTYWVQCIGGGDGNETQKTTGTSATVDRLDAATSYACSVWAEQDGASGAKEDLTVSTAPNAVRNLTVGAQTSSSITLVWEAPEGPASQNLTYWVQCIGGGDGNETQKTTGTSATVDRLDAATSYACSVWAEQDGASGAKEDLTVSTAPNAVRNLTVGARTNSSITLFWEPPEGAASQGLTYWVQCIGGGGRNKTQNTASTSATVDGLDAGSTYELRVWVEKNGVSSSQETSNVTTAPSEVVDLQNMTQTNSSVTLRWTAPTDPHSQLYTYWVRWASEGLPQRQQDPQVDWANQMNKTSETSYEVQALVPGTWYNFSVWAERNDVAGSMQSLRVSTVPGSITIQSCVSSSGGYGVTLTWSCPLGGYEAFELQVGGQQLQQDRSTCNKGVSVSGLQPARSYRASVTTLWDGLRVMSTPTTCHTESGGVIAGAIVGVLLLLVLVGLLVFFLRRRKRKSQEKAVPKDLVFSSPGDILAGDFAHHVWRQGKDSNCGFAEEYQQLALEGQGQAQTVASAPENATKNRYRNVLPYDWSRVPLKPLHGEPGSDYINASFLPGLCSPREFIAAQGPLPHTVGDFWRLVWEQQSHTLVMLTNCMESGRVKCEHYWPLDAQPCTHGRLRVALVAEEVAENWAVRDLELLQLDEQQTLSVRQFHYLAWPDHGVPHSPDPLLDFWRMLRQWLDQTGDGGPPIVHCSAGVGRTGTLIALDVLLRQLESEGLLGPFRFVRKMRESRPLMVQTEAQYVFLHQCILRFLQRAAAAPAQEEATGDHVPDPIYENVAALQALEVEA